MLKFYHDFRGSKGQSPLNFISSTFCMDRALMMKERIQSEGHLFLLSGRIVVDHCEVKILHFISHKRDDCGDIPGVYIFCFIPAANFAHHGAKFLIDASDSQ